MCLAVPGRIETLDADGPLGPMGKVNFGGILKEVNLAYVPEATVGDYVIVHVGFALSRLDEEEALKTLEYFRQMGELAELAETSQEPAAPGASHPPGSAAPPGLLPRES